MLSLRKGPFERNGPEIIGVDADTTRLGLGPVLHIWVVVKIRVLFWVPNIVRHLIFRYPKRDDNFDNYPYRGPEYSE